MISIQELENLNAENFKDDPEVLISYSEELLFNKKYEKAIEFREKAIKYTIEKNNNDPNNMKCAPFYVHYAEALIIKLMETQDLFTNPVEKIEEKSEEYAEEINGKPSNFNNINLNVTGENIEKNFKGTNHSNLNLEKTQESKTEIEEETQSKVEEEGQQKNQVEDGVEIIDENHKQNENNQEEASVEDLEDEEIASENLAFAENIYIEYLKEYMDENHKKEVTNDVKKCFFGLAEVYLKMGDLETCRSDFQLAVEKYLKALKIRKEYDNKYSRCIAEIYFNLSKVYDFDAKKCLLSLIKARLIMEYHMKNKLNSLGKVDLEEKINFDEQLLDQDEIEYKSYKSKNELYYENEEFVNAKLPNDILELCEIIKELDQKIEDVIVDLETFENLKKVEGKQDIQESFTENYDKSKVIDIKALGLVKKRDRKDLEKNPYQGGKSGENDDENKISSEKIPKLDRQIQLLNSDNKESA